MPSARYAEGTRILSTRGDVSVEALRIGEPVITASGERRSIRWIGHRRLDTARHPDRGPSGRSASRPALSPRTCRPRLWTSPGHNVFLDGVLMPIRVLVNGATVVQIA